MERQHLTLLYSKNPTSIDARGRGSTIAGHSADVTTNPMLDYSTAGAAPIN